MSVSWRAGIKRKVIAIRQYALDLLQKFIDEKRTWLFGHLGYDLKNEQLNSSPAIKSIQFPDLFFFEPEIIIRLNGKEMIIEASDPQKIFDEISFGHPIEEFNYKPIHTFKAGFKRKNTFR